MSKRFFFVLIFIIISSFFKTSIVNASPCPVSINPSVVSPDFNNTLTITTSNECFQPNVQYLVVSYPVRFDSDKDFLSGPQLKYYYPNIQTAPIDKKTFTIKVDLKNTYNVGKWLVNICITDINNYLKCKEDPDRLAGTGTFEVSKTAAPPPPPPADLPIIDKVAQTQCKFQAGQDVPINRIINIQPNTTYNWWWAEGTGFLNGQIPTIQTIPPTTLTEISTEVIIGDMTKDKIGSHKLCLDKDLVGRNGKRQLQNCIDLTFAASKPEGDTSCKDITKAACSEKDVKEGKCTSGGGKEIGSCSDRNDPKYDPKNPGIATAIGCIHTNPPEFAKDLLKFIIGIGGGLAFLMMLLGAFQMLTSAGNPETLNAGRERLTSAVIGLLFVIFTILLLQIIGIGILNLPGFEK